jgi:hypothetical protein
MKFKDERYRGWFIEFRQDSLIVGLIVGYATKGGYQEPLTQAGRSKGVVLGNLKEDIDALENQRKLRLGSSKVCPRCGLNPNFSQSTAQQKWELDYIKKHGICHSCEEEEEGTIDDTEDD